MLKYKVRFARVVIAEEEFEAEDLWEAMRLASNMEREGKLSILIDHYLDEGQMVLDNNVVDIQDYEYIWEVEEVGGEPEPVFTTAFAVIKNEKGKTDAERELATNS